jgi:replicative superfamily II helicase
LYILPFVSIVMEKQKYLTKLCENINLKITALHSLSDQQWTPSTDLCICTIEKANALVNKVIEERTYFDIELFIIDELHLLLDEGRGFLLECLISKL